MGVFDLAQGVCAPWAFFISKWIGYHLVSVSAFLYHLSKDGEKDRVKIVNPLFFFQGGQIAGYQE